MASIDMRSLVVGALHPDYPGDPFHHILMTILMAARARGVQAIDGPFLQVRDVDAFREVAKRSAVLGFDGKWVLHPGQVDAANEIYSPSQEDYDHAELILDAYECYLRGRREEGLGDARRRDDRRGQPQDGPGHRRQGPRRRHEPDVVLHPARGMSGKSEPLASIEPATTQIAAARRSTTHPDACR